MTWFWQLSTDRYSLYCLKQCGYRLCNSAYSPEYIQVSSHKNQPAATMGTSAGTFCPKKLLTHCLVLSAVTALTLSAQSSQIFIQVQKKQQYLYPNPRQKSKYPKAPVSDTGKFSYPKTQRHTLNFPLMIILRTHSEKRVCHYKLYHVLRPKSMNQSETFKDILSVHTQPQEWVNAWNKVPTAIHSLLIFLSVSS